MTAPAIVASVSGFDSANTTTSTIILPSFTDGDSLYLLIASDAASQVFGLPKDASNSSTGFTALYSDVAIPATSATATFAVFYLTNAQHSRFSFDGSNYSMTAPVTTSERQAWWCISVSGDGGIDAQGTTATGNSATATIPAITTTTNNALVIGAVLTDQVSTPHGTATGYTKIGEVSGTSAATVSAFYQATTTAGAVSSATVSITSEQWAGISFAIKEVVTGRTGTASITLGTLTATAAGSVAVQGSSSITLDALTLSGAGNVPRTGSASITLGAATLSATGTGATTRTGTAAITLGAVTSSAAGVVPITGSAGITLDAATTTAAGAVAIKGTGTAQLNSLSVSASGTVPVIVNPPSIRAGWSKGADTGNTNTTVVTLPDGSFSDGDTVWIAIVSDAGSQVFTAPDRFTTLYSNVAVSGSTATLAVFYQRNISKASEVFDGANYVFSVGVATSERQSWICFATTGDGTIDVQGTTATGSSTAASIPTLTTTANADLVLGIVATDGTTTPHTATTYSKLDESAGVSAGSISVWYQTKPTAGVVAADTVSIVNEQWAGVSFALAPGLGGRSAITLDPLTVSATGSMAVRGTAAITLSPLTTTSSGTVPRTGSASITLDPLTVNSNPPRTGTLSSTLGAVTVAATGSGTAPRTGTANITLGSVTSSASGSLGVDLPAPTIRSYSSGYDAANTTTTVIYLPDFQNGDTLYIALVSDRPSQTFNLPYDTFGSSTGWQTLYSNVAIPTASPTATFALFYLQNAQQDRFYYDPDLGQYTCVVPVVIPERQSYIALAVTGDGGADEQGVNVTGNSVTATIPAITTTKNNSLLVGIVATDGDSTPHTGASGYTWQTEVDGPSAGSMSLWTHVLGTAGTYSADSVSMLSEQWLGISFSIPPTLPGRVNVTLGDLTTSATGVVPVKGSAAITLGELTTTTTGKIPVTGGSAVIDFKSVTAITTSATSPLTISTPSVNAGELMLMHIGHSNARATTYPSGWTQVITSGSGAEVNRIDILYRVADGTEAASYELAWTGSETVSAAIMVLNNTAGVPMRVVDSAVNITTDGSRVWPSTSLNYANGFLACFGTLGINSGTTPAASFTEKYDSGATVRMYLMIEQVSGPQTTGTITTTGGGAGTGRYVSVMVTAGGGTDPNSVTLGPLTLTSLPPRQGTLSTTLGALTASSTGVVRSGRVGNANITLGALTVSGAGQAQQARPTVDPASIPIPSQLATRFTISVENAAGVKLGGGPIITGAKWSYKQKLSAAGEWSLEVPLAEPRLAVATLKRRVHCYVRRSGRLVWLGGGIIESRSYGLSGDSVPVMTLSGPDLLRELTGVTAAFEVNALDAAPRANTILNDLFATVPTWTATLPDSLPEITARFVHESVLNALVGTCEKLGAFFWMEPYVSKPRSIIIATAPVVSSIVATNMADPLAAERNQNLCIISNIERTETSWDAYNRLIVYGAGDGQARLTLAAATQWPNGSSVSYDYLYTDPYGRQHEFSLDKTTNTITDVLAVAEYGTIEQAAAFKEIAPITPNDADMIAAANTLVVAAVNQLVLSSFPTESYRLSVAALRAVVHPGMQIRVIARKYRDGLPYINVDQRLIIQEVDYEIDAEGEKVTALTVATTWKPEKTGATILSEQIQKITALEAHPQMGANENTISYREDVDDDYGAAFPFWLSRGTQTINSIILRYKLEQLRSSVKTIGGTATGSVTIPAHSHQVSIPSHQHGMDIDSDATIHGFARVMYFDPTSGKLYYDLSGGGANAFTSQAGGSATVTSGGGGNGTVAVDISNAITAVYGVFVDSGPAYNVDDLAWTANGQDITATPVVIGGGWYEVDITSLLIDTTTLRPAAYDNTVEVTVKPTNKAAKKVRVTAQIELRTTVQTLRTSGAAVDRSTGGIRGA